MANKTSPHSSWAIAHTPLSATEVSKYFFLPTLGGYLNGQLDNVGEYGGYWSSSGSASGMHSFHMSISYNSIGVVTIYEGYLYGMRADALFE